MQAVSCIFLLFLLLALIANDSCFSSAAVVHFDGIDYQVPDEMLKSYIVKFNSKDSVDSFYMGDESRGMVMDEIEDLNALVLKFDSEEEAQEWANDRDDVEYVERDYLIFQTTTEEISGETTPYGIDMVNGLDIDYVEGSGIKICIIDSGYDHGHEDLPHNKTDIVTGTSWWCDEADDDDLPICRWYIDGDDGDDDDNGGHGTHVAGTIAAIGGNGVGVVGVIGHNKVPIHIVRAMRTNVTTSSKLVEAMAACKTAGANILNMSMKMETIKNPEKNTLGDQIKRYMNETDRMLIIAAAGNAGDSSKSYPASYPGVMSVASVDRNKTKSSFSQFNDEVDIAAPGRDINSTLPNKSYGTRSGTSHATPHVSAIAAKIWSHKPSMTAQEVHDILTSTAEDLGDKGRDDEYGWGLVDASAAYKLLQNDIPCEDASVGFLFEGEKRKCAWVANDSTELCQNDSIKSVCPETCQACAYKCSDATLPFYPLQIWKQMTCEKLATDFTSHEMNEICGWSKFRNTCRKTCNYCEL